MRKINKLIDRSAYVGKNLFFFAVSTVSDNIINRFFVKLTDKLFIYLFDWRGQQ